MRPTHYNSRYKNSLSPREREILGGVARGLTNAEIAANLGLSFETVKSHVGTILAKLEVQSREQAASWWRYDHSFRGRVEQATNALIAIGLRKSLRFTAAGTGSVVAGIAVLVLFFSGTTPEPPPSADEPVCSTVLVQGSADDFPANLCEPAGTDNNRGSIVILDDCSNLGTEWEFAREAARRGYVVVTPDYRPAPGQAAAVSYCALTDDRTNQARGAVAVDAIRFTKSLARVDQFTPGVGAVVARGRGSRIALFAAIQTQLERPGAKEVTVTVLFSSGFSRPDVDPFPDKRGWAPILAFAVGNTPEVDAAAALVAFVQGGGGKAEYVVVPGADPNWGPGLPSDPYETAFAFLREHYAMPFPPTTPAP